MNNTTLQSLRKSLFLDVREAAELIGGVSPRAWQYWEAGDRPVPDDVEEKIEALIKIADDIFKDVLDEGFEYSYKYYDFEEFAKRFEKNTLKWRIYQCVLARLLLTLGTPVETERSDSSAPEDCVLYQRFEQLSL